MYITTLSTKFYDTLVYNSEAVNILKQIIFLQNPIKFFEKGKKKTDTQIKDMEIKNTRMFSEKERGNQNITPPSQKCVISKLNQPVTKNFVKM